MPNSSVIGPDTPTIEDSLVRGTPITPDPDAQEIYNVLKSRGVFTADPEAQAIGHELRARGVVADPTQGGLVSPPASVAPIRPPQGATGGGALPVVPYSPYAAMSPSERHLTDLLSSTAGTFDSVQEPFLQSVGAANFAKGPAPTLPKAQWGIPGTPIFNDAQRLGGIVSRPVQNGITVATFGKGGPKRYYGPNGEPLPSGDPMVAAAIGAVHPNMQAADIPQVAADTYGDNGTAYKASGPGFLPKIPADIATLGSVPSRLVESGWDLLNKADQAKWNAIDASIAKSAQKAGKSNVPPVAQAGLSNAPALAQQAHDSSQVFDQVAAQNVAGLAPYGTGDAILKAAQAAASGDKARAVQLLQALPAGAVAYVKEHPVLGLADTLAVVGAVHGGIHAAMPKLSPAESGARSVLSDVNRSPVIAPPERSATLQQPLTTGEPVPPPLNRPAAAEPIIQNGKVKAYAAKTPMAPSRPVLAGGEYQAPPPDTLTGLIDHSKALSNKLQAGLDENRADLARSDDAGQAVRDMEAAAEGGSARAGLPTSFETAKGSTYEVDENGQTTRTKTAHAGHETSDVGVKDKSDKTYYVSPADSQRIGMHGAMSGKKTLRVSDDGKQALLLGWNNAANNWGLSPSERTAGPITLHDTPQVGLHPVELWNGQGNDFGKWHPGNEITKVNGNAQFPANEIPSKNSVRPSDYIAPDAPVKPILTNVHNRQEFRDAVQQHFGYTDEQTDAAMATADGHARLFEAGTGRPAADWYKENIAAVGKGYDGGGLNQAGDAPSFYSQAERVVQANPQKSMRADQWQGFLNSRGVKPDEMKWTGLNDFLDEKAGQQVSKADVLDHLAGNKVDLNEIVKGKNWNGLYNSGEEYSDAFHKAQDAGEWNKAADIQEEWDLFRAQHSDTKYGSYQLPGGKNYREMLLQLPPRLPEDTKGFYIKPDGDGFTIERNLGGIRSSLGQGKYPTREEATVALNRYLTKYEDAPDAPVYRSSHWDEPNVLAHIRMSDRTGPNGQKVLHVEEVQSDWHQDGRKKGYGRDNAKAAQAGRDLEDYQARTKDLKSRLHRNILKESTGFDSYIEVLKHPDKANLQAKFNVAKDNNPDYQSIIQEEDRLSAEMSKYNNGVQNAPFSKTWHELAAKKILDYAARNGYDEVAWTPGEEQGKRYSEDNGGPKDQARTAGMKGFYDKILPDTFNKIGKRFGAKVGETPVVTNNDGRMVDDGAGGLVREGGKPVETPLHSLPITDEMRRSLTTEGQPLFEHSQGQNKGSVNFRADGKAIIRALDNPDASTVPHELAHVFRRSLFRDQLLPKADLDYIEEWAGVKDSNWTPQGADGKLDPVHEEKWSRAFERYLSEGKADWAPEPLQRAFASFKKWMQDIYNGIKGSAIDVELTPQIREIFARVLGKGLDEPIKASEGTPGPHGTSGPDYIGSRKESKMGGTDEQNAEARQVAEREGMNAKPVTTWGDTQANADQLGIQYETIKDLKPGQMPIMANGEHPRQSDYLKSLWNLYAYYRDEVSDLRLTAKTSAEKAQLAELETRRDLIHKHADAGSHEWGVTGSNALQNDVVPTKSERVMQLLRDAPRIEPEGLKPTPGKAPKGVKNGARPKSSLVSDADLQKAIDDYKAGKGQALAQIAHEPGALFQSQNPNDPLNVVGRYHYDTGAKTYDKFKTAVEGSVGPLTDADAQALYAHTKADADAAKQNAQTQQKAIAKRVFVNELAQRFKSVDKASEFINDISDGPNNTILNALIHDLPLTDKQLQVIAKAEVKATAKTQGPPKPPVSGTKAAANLRKIIADAKQGKLNYDDPVDQTRDYLMKALPENDLAGAAEISKMLAGVERDKATGQVTYKGRQQLAEGVSRLSRQSTADNIEHYIRANLLSNPATLTKIAISHMLSAATEDIPVRAVASGADRLLAKKTGRRSVADVSARDTVGAVGKGLAEHGGAVETLLHGESTANLGKHTPLHDTGKALRGEIATRSKLFNAIMRSPMRTHAAVYRMIGSGLYDRGLREAAKLEAQKPGATQTAEQLYNAPTPEMMTHAREQYQQQMFTNDNLVNNTLKPLTHSKNALIRTPANATLPFAKVPINIAGRAAEYNPIGATISAIKQAIDVKNGGKPMTVSQQANIARTIGRGVTGTAMTALGYELYHQHVLNAVDDKHHEYGSVNAIGRKTDVGGLGPISTPTLFGANIGKAIDDAGKGLTPDYAGIAKAYFDDQPILRTSENAQVLDDPKKLAQIGANLLSEFIPYSSALRGIAAQTDPTHSMRSKDGVLGAVKNGLPWLREQNPPAIDTFGQSIPEAGNAVGLRSVPLPNVTPVQQKALDAYDMLDEIDTASKATPRSDEDGLRKQVMKSIAKQTANYLAQLSQYRNQLNEGHTDAKPPKLDPKILDAATYALRYSKTIKTRGDLERLGRKVNVIMNGGTP